MRIRLLPESSPLGWTPFAWLVYLSFFLVYAIWNNSPRDWLIDGPALALFLVLYFRGFWLEGRPLLGGHLRHRRHRPGGRAAQPGRELLLHLRRRVRRRSRPAGRRRAVAARHSRDRRRQRPLLLSLSPPFWVPALVISVLVGGSNIHFCEMRRKDRALIKAHEEAEHMATIAERERIARDLHDLLGHTLSIIVLKSELAAKVADRDLGRAVREIRDVERISRNALAEVRHAVYGYRGERLEEELATARTALDAAGVALDRGRRARSRSTPTQERALSLALREAVTNVIRHARARHCRVTLDRGRRRGVRLTVEDDGVGGEPAEGAGLSGMRARLAEIGGTMERDARRGTRLTLVVPRRPTVARAMVAS